jgi:hypothetical protein
VSILRGRYIDRIRLFRLIDLARCLGGRRARREYEYEGLPTIDFMPNLVGLAQNIRLCAGI